MNNVAAIKAGLEAILQLINDDAGPGAPTPEPVFSGPTLAGFLAARAKSPPDGSYPSMMTFALSQKEDMTNSLTAFERQTITNSAWRIGSSFVGALPVTMPYSQVLYRFLHPEAYNPRTGQPQTEADRLAEEAAARAWDAHWDAKPKPGGSVDVAIG